MDLRQERIKLIEGIDKIESIVKKYDVNVKDNFDHIKQDLKNDLTFNVLVLGEFSSGKTTFINRYFLNEDILPTAYSVTTARICSIYYSTTPTLKIKFKDEMEEFYDNQSEFKTILEKSVKKDGKDTNRVDSIKLYFESQKLKDGIVIIDTPGLNDPEAERMKLTMDYIDHADSVLYLISAQQAWKNSEKEFLEEKIMRKKDIDKIFFLLNFWDIVEEIERESLIEYVTQEMNKSIKVVKENFNDDIKIPQLIPISSKTKENFDILDEKIWQYLSETKGEEIVKVKKKKIRKIVNDIIEDNTYNTDLYNKHTEEIENRLNIAKRECDEYRDKANDIKEEIKNRLLEIWRSLFNRLKKEVEMYIIPEVINTTLNNLVNTTDLSSIDEAFLIKILNKNIEKVMFINKKIFDDEFSDYIRQLAEIKKEYKSRYNIKSNYSEYFFNDLSIKSSSIDSLDILKSMSKNDTLKSISAGILGGSLGNFIAGNILFAISYSFIFTIPAGFLAAYFFANKALKNKINSDILNDNSNIKISLENELKLLFFKQLDELDNKNFTILVDEFSSQLENEIIVEFQNRENNYNKIIQDKNNSLENEKIDSFKNASNELEDFLKDF